MIFICQQGGCTKENIYLISLKKHITSDEES